MKKENLMITVNNEERENIEDLLDIAILEEEFTNIDLILGKDEDPKRRVNIKVSEEKFEVKISMEFVEQASFEIIRIEGEGTERLNNALFAMLTSQSRLAA